MASISKTYLVVAAIDFGTTYSGHAYAFVKDFIKPADQVVHICSKEWVNELAGTRSMKTPTSILFNEDGSFDSFGFEAEKRYAELADDNEHKGWRFFKHFKMMLYECRSESTDSANGSSPVPSTSAPHQTQRGRARRKSRGRRGASSSSTGGARSRSRGADLEEATATTLLQDRDDMMKDKIKSMTKEQLEDLCLKMVSSHPGLVFNILKPAVSVPEEFHPPSGSSTPEWCVCGQCRQMPKAEEKVCCGYRDCISLLPKIKRSTKLKDDQGKTMKALDVFSAAIKYLKDDVMNTLNRRATVVYDSDVKWVITVPAIWNYKAKQFMVEAAIQAGIDGKHVCLAHEPESAAIYCKHIQVCREENTNGNPTLKCFKEGSRFMILDLGGGTVDITACEVQNDGSLIELCPRGGGPWGGNVVNAYIYQLIERFIGTDVMKTFSNNCTYDFLKLNEYIELKKRVFTQDKKADEVKLELPFELLKLYERQQNESQSTSRSQHIAYPCIKRNKLHFTCDSFSRAFTAPIDGIVKAVRSLERTFNIEKLGTFIMVGGFSESPIMQQAVRDAFPEKTIIIPEETSTAILKGAVLYGHRSSYIKSRVLPYSFGIAITENYDAIKHPGAIVNFKKVEDIFYPYVRKGQTVPENGIQILREFGNTSQEVEVFQTPVDELANPSYTYEEHFERIGKVDVSNSPSDAKTVDVKMTFGIFDIKVSTCPKGSEKWIEKSFDTL